MSEMEKKRLHIQFFGQVQGVGFRYTAYHVAQKYGLTGWVKNEYDGSVSCEVQGYPEEVDAFLRAMQGGHFIIVDRIERCEQPVKENERSFGVVY